MEKKSGTHRAMPRMSIEELKALNTKALLARLKRLRFCEDSPAQSDLTDEEIASVGNLILFKSDPEWTTAYRDLKQVLNGREHVES